MEDGRRRDYGACVPDVEPEERVTLEEDPAETTTTTKAKKSKTAARKKSRRLTDEERANLLATHHTHVMCVFARGMLVRAAASSALLRALVSSCAPPELARSVGAASSSSCSTIEVGTLARLVDWFADVIAPPICLDDEEEEEEDEKKKKTRVKDARWRRRAFGVALSRAGRGVDGGAARLAARLAHLWSKRGTVRMSEEASAALFAALCQGLGLSCRLVLSLEPTPIRAEAAKLESIGALRSSKVPSVDADVRDAGDYARHWCEVLCARREENGETIPRWVCAAPTTRGSCDSRRLYSGTENARPRRTHPRRCRTSSRFTRSRRERRHAQVRARVLAGVASSNAGLEVVGKITTFAERRASRRRGERLRAGDANAARACRRGGDVRDGREEFERARAEHDDGD